MDFSDPNDYWDYWGKGIEQQQKLSHIKNREEMIFYNSEVMDLLSLEVSKDEDTSTEQDSTTTGWKQSLIQQPPGTILLPQSSVDVFDWLDIYIF